MATLPIKIAVLGDDHVAARLLEQAVQAVLPGAAILAAATGDDGIALVAAADPDVILLGVAENADACCDLCRRLKADARLAGFPVLLLTAPDTAEVDRSAALDAGVDGFLANSFDAPELIAQVRAMAKIRAANRVTPTQSEAALVEQIRALQVELLARSRREAALRASRTALDLILNTVPQSIFWKDREGRYLGCNKVFASAAGLDDPAQIIGKTDFDLPWPRAEAEAYLADDRQVLESNQPKLHIIEPLQTADGVRHWIDTSKMPLSDESGQVYAVLGVYEDITERRQATQALNKFFDQPNSLHLIARLDATIVRVNLGWENLLGYPREELEGTSFFELVHPDDRAATLDEMANLGQGDTTYYFENRYRHKQGGYRVLAWSALADLEEHLVYAIATDITERKQAEAALRASEEQLRTVFDVASVGIVQVDPSKGNLLRFNDKYREITGFSAAELRDICFPELTHPDDREHDWEVFAAAARGETPNHSNEKRYVRKDGSVIWVRLSAAFVRNDAGQPILTVAVCEDITERKAAEAAQRASEERYRSLLERAPIGIAVHDGERVLFVNPAGANLLGAESPAQIVGKSIIQFVHPDSRQMMAERVRRALNGEQNLPPVEYIFARLDGRSIDVEVTSAALNFYGKPTVQLTARDITERKRAEAERAQFVAQMQAQAQQISQILDTVPEGVLLLGEEGRVLLANPTGLRDLRVLADASVGDRLTHLGDLAIAQLLAAAHGGPWHELHAGHQTFEVIARPLALAQTEQSGGRWVVVIDNVTRDRNLRAELQQQERLAAVGQLAAGIAHDFNNILAIITLQGAMAIQTPYLPARVAERLAVITEQAEHATRLVQQILDFSRRAVLERRPLDLAALLRAQVDLLARTLPEYIEITLECGTDDYVVLADATRIQQMVMNLAVNARDAMPSGGSLRLTLARQDTPPQPGLPAGPWICLTVVDTGDGIAPEAMAHLFEPFFTTKQRGRGTGLGLAQVYGIVKQHAGEITVHSIPGQGATITVCLPAVAMRADTVVESATAAPTGAGATILLVEDNPLLLDAMIDILTLLDYTVIGAANGKEALAVLEKGADGIALVLTDLIMPQMSGDALLANMRARGLPTPVVILSGHPLESELDALKQHGLAGWLLKPPNIQDLAQVLAQAISK